MIEERQLQDKKKKIDLFENVIEQAKLIFLSGKYKDFECAFHHIENRIKYEINNINQHVKQEAKK